MSQARQVVVEAERARAEARPGVRLILHEDVACVEVGLEDRLPRDIIERIESWIYWKGKLVRMGEDRVRGIVLCVPRGVVGSLPEPELLAADAYLHLRREAVKMYRLRRRR